MYQPRVPIFPRLSEAQRKISLLGGALVTGAALGIPLLVRNLTRKNSSVAQTTASAADVTPNIHITRTVTVNQPIETVYHFWRDLSNLPQIMDYIESVYVIGNTLTRWTLKLPGDLKAEFDVETYIDMPNEMISWRSLPESEIPSGGSVRFQTVDEGTQIDFTVEFVPPAGALGEAIASLISERYIDHALHEFKRSREETSVDVEIHGGV